VLLKTSDIRLLTMLLSPGYSYAAAREHGLGDAMSGAYAAHVEARGAIRALLRSLLERERRRLVLHDFGRVEEGMLQAKRELRGALLALGYRHRFQPLDLEPIATRWRGLALSAWPVGCPISSPCDLSDGGAGMDPSKLVRGVIRAVSTALRDDPQLNRAVLGGRVWRRQTSEVMVHAELGEDEIEPLVVDAAGLSDAALAAELRSQMRTALKSLRHPLAPAGAAITRAWVESGFLASPAGAMISDCTRTALDAPTPALVLSNGVPLAVGIGRPRGGTATCIVVADHRAGDASLWGRMHAWLRDLVPKLLAEP